MPSKSFPDLWGLIWLVGFVDVLAGLALWMIASYLHVGNWIISL